MNIEEHKKIALAYFEERSAGNSRAFDRLAESTIWRVMAKGPMGGTKTKAELLKILTQTTARFEEPVKFTVTGITAEGDRVAIEAQGHAELTNGKVYRNTYHYLFVFRDGKICRGKLYNDTKHAAEIQG